MRRDGKAVFRGGRSGHRRVERDRPIVCQGPRGPGRKVYVIARSRERLAATVDEMQRAGGDAHSLPVDVTSEEQLVHAASVIESDAGKVDILIAGAGIMDLGPVETMPSETFEAMMRVNYLGVVHTVRAFLPLVNKGGQGRIAILSSLAAKISPPYFAAYSASKAAVTGFAHALRQELLHQGTRVVLIHPGPTATPLVDGYIGGEYYPVPPGVPVVSPELVAKVVLRAIERGQAEVFVPRRLMATAWLAGLLPASSNT